MVLLAAFGGGCGQPQEPGANPDARPGGDGGAGGGADAEATDPCGDGLDGDRDGTVDENCACTVGETQRCFSGDPGKAGRGDCTWGTQQCESAGEFGVWGACEGSGDCDGSWPDGGCGSMDEFGSTDECCEPSEEVCDGQDNDCDGRTDEGLPPPEEPSGEGPSPAPWGHPMMQPGIMAVTCAVGESSSHTFGLFDVGVPNPDDYGPAGSSAALWNPRMLHHDSWTVEQLGNVYGIAIDYGGDIYVAAHGLYSGRYELRYGDIGGGATSLDAAGTVYRIDGGTGETTVFTTSPLPQQRMTLSDASMTGPGLGNLAYDRDHDQFFVTNLEDGAIYRLDDSGERVGKFDPLGPDDGAPGLPPLGERLWGIGYHGGSVYYAVWGSADDGSSDGSGDDDYEDDFGFRDGGGSPGTLRRVELLASGAIDPDTDVEVLTLPSAQPVADIAFSEDGRTMILGERTMLSDTRSYNHMSNVHLAAPGEGGSWEITHTLAPGDDPGDAQGEAYGGVSFGPEDGVDEALIYMSSADMATSAGPHGIQGTRVPDFETRADRAYRIPYNPSFTTSGPDVKGSGGDVELMPPALSCEP